MKEAISRYSNLKLILDNQEWNNNWVEVNTLNVDCSKSNLTFVDLFSGQVVCQLELLWQV